MSKEIYEKLGLFYLGRDADKETMQTTDTLTLLKNKDFTTHAAIIGMTGSGKTGLGIGIIEEAAIDNIPSIVIDPKGDMGDLCLTDAAFSPEAFEPWVRDEALAKGEEPLEYAKKVADQWREGLAGWDQEPSRVENFAKVKKTIYTPGSSSGVSINVLGSLEAPPAEVMEDNDTFASYIKATVSSLLSLIGIEADPVNSKEYILLAQLITERWTMGKSISIEDIINSINNPPFKKIGVLALESYYPQDERFKLASKFNALIASPSFASWLQGNSLDIQTLLYDEKGKAKIAIFSISHLSDDERMFFVTLLLNKYIAWMRQQSGTSSLKTLLYMDEIFGFFPPTKNPPSKEPMLLLLKQARAYGIGIILSTQNPVDLDYKGLSNIGTWLIGRLQTNQDIERVIDGLGGKIGSNFNKEEIKKLLANLRKRIFFLKSAHLDDVSLFETRWAMSYLKGPLKKEEISKLMASQKNNMPQSGTAVRSSIQNEEDDNTYQGGLDDSVLQYFEEDRSGTNRYIPSLGAKISVNFYDQSRGIDTKSDETLFLTLLPLDTSLEWEKASKNEIDFTEFSTSIPNEAHLGRIPDFLLNDQNLTQAKRLLSEMLYREKKLELFRCKTPKMESKPDESERDFRVRLQDSLNEMKEEAIEKLKEEYDKKEQVIRDRLRRADALVEKEEHDVSSKTTDTLVSAGLAVLGAFFGSRSTAKIGTTINKGSRVLKERGDVQRAQERVDELQNTIDELEHDLEEKIDLLDKEFDIDNQEIESFAIKPRKSDIAIKSMALVWSRE